MKRESLMLFFAFSITSCVIGDGKIGLKNQEEKITEIDAPWAREQVRCGKIWEEIISEWKKNNGGLKASILETRAQIASDKTSRFSRYVKSTWAAQVDSGNFDQMDFMPKSNEDYFVVAQAFGKANGMSTPDGCGDGMLEGFVWEELVNAGSQANRVVTKHGSTILKFSDVPSSVEWSSPNAQFWTTYWLLRRVDP